MSASLSLLRDGLRLALMRRPRATPLGVGFGHWLGFALVALVFDATWSAFLVAPPRLVNAWGVQTALAAGLLRLATAAVICAVTRRSAIYWTVACWLEAASLLVTLVAGFLYAASPHSEWPLFWIGWWLSITWLLAILLRTSAFLAVRAWWRAFAAGLLGYAVLVAPWFWLDAQWLWETDYSQYEDGTLVEAEREVGLRAPEATFYAQAERVQAAVSALAPQRADHVDLFGVAFGGDASENVFRNEVEYFSRFVPARFDAAGHVLALLNHRATSERWPLATATNLERSLLALGERMDRDQDILLLYLTSHGSETHEFYLNQPPLPLDQLTPARLRAALDASGIRWRVLVVSACYSGGYVDALRDRHTLVITAAAADRPSFGCGVDSEITWFGKAFLAQALNEDVDFIAAFEAAKRSIEAWEKDEQIDPPSNPQIDIGAEIGAHLARWRGGFTPGDALPFTPAADVDADADADARTDAASESEPDDNAVDDEPDATPQSDA